MPLSESKHTLIIVTLAVKSTLIHVHVKNYPKTTTFSTQIRQR